METESQSPTIETIKVDKFGSVVSKLKLSHTLRITSDTNAPGVGDVVVVKTITDNPSYNKLELVSGRQARVKVGDIVVGALGRRRALKGFVGDVPKTMNVGDTLQLLNMGGLVGRSTGRFHGLGRPIQVQLLGIVVDEEGKKVNINRNALPTVEILEKSAPLILVAGTSMNVGKTQVVAELTMLFTRNNYHVNGAKLSGVAALRDMLDMEDHGAKRTLSFIDCGLPSTVGFKDLGPTSRTILHHLNTDNPDVIIVEMGDGLIGGYNVESIFQHKDLMDKVACTILCAPDFVGAWGGIQLLEQHGMRPDIVSGPSTDSKMGVTLMKKKFNVDSANAIHNGSDLFALTEACVKRFQQKQP